MILKYLELQGSNLGGLQTQISCYKNAKAITTLIPVGFCRLPFSSFFSHCSLFSTFISRKLKILEGRFAIVGYGELQEGFQLLTQNSFSFYNANQQTFRIQRKSLHCTLLRFSNIYVCIVLNSCRVFLIIKMLDA